MDYSAPLQYHYHPAKGWVNDPNGLVCFGGYYHVFYQHCPNHEVPGKEAMYWGHARTKDFLHWEELPVALAPTAPYDNCGCWSGTAIVKGDVLYLFYASLYVPEGEKEPLQTVSVAYSTDGVNFEKYAGNPVIGHWPADGSPDFRDPAVCCVDGEYYCVMASGNVEAKEARLLLYKSTDLLHWEYSGILSSWEDAFVTECPSLVNTDGGRQLLAASVCTQEKHWFSLMYGRLADGKFRVEAVGEVDKGPDQYAGQVFADTLGRALLISWVPGWPYAGYYAPKDIGCMSVPRQLTLGADGVVRGYPVKELQHLLKTEDPAVQRTADGFIIPRTGREPVVYTGTVRELAILRDEYILEVFVNGGEEIFTVLL